MIKIFRNKQVRVTFCNLLLLHSSLAVILSLLLILSLFTNDIVLGVPNRYYTPLKPTNPTTASNSLKPVTVNHPPLVKVGPNQTVNENTSVTLLGVASDPDLNDKLSYSWKQISGPAVKLTNSSSTNPSFVAPTVSSDRDLKFSLKAKDDKGAVSNPVIITITVKHTNHPPLANAAADQTVNPGDIVTLDGSKSRDPDSSDLLSYLWMQTTGPTVKLDSANTSIATFTAPSNISSDTTLGFKLTVKDDKNASGVDDVKVTDKYVPPPNQPPVANAGSDQTVNSGDTVTLDGSGSRDPDGNIASYSWTQTAGPSVTLNDGNTTNPTFTAPTVSHDTDLKFSLIAKDNKGAISGPVVVTVIVKHVNHPPVANAGLDQTVNENTTVKLDGTKSNDPDGNIASYSWVQSAGPAVTLNGANTDTSSFIAPSGISSDTLLTFKLTVTDKAGAEDTAAVNVTVKYVPPSSPPTTPAPINHPPSPVPSQPKQPITGGREASHHATIINKRVTIINQAIAIAIASASGGSSASASAAAAAGRRS